MRGSHLQGCGKVSASPVTSYAPWPRRTAAADGRLQPVHYGMQAVDEDCVWEICGAAQGYSGKHKDNLSGQVLKDSLVVEACKKEVDFFWSKGI